MGANSGITWTGATYNPWQGCVKKTIEIDGKIKLREECRNCYMYREKKRYGKNPAIVVRSSPATFNAPLKWQKEIDEGKRSKLGLSRLVFTCSWSDFFNPEADEWRPEAWRIIRLCPDLIFQILTKLPQRALDHLPPFWEEIEGRVHMGVSAGYQEAAEEMIPHLLAIPARIRFLSCEPLLGPLDLRKWLLKWQPVGFGPGEDDWDFDAVPSEQIHWIIAGGESGPNARPTNHAWIRSLKRQCAEADVPFFVKQLGSVWAKEAGVFRQDDKGHKPEYWPEDLRVREFPVEVMDDAERVF